jgi:hypothetical protein
MGPDLHFRPEKVDQSDTAALVSALAAELRTLN